LRRARPVIEETLRQEEERFLRTLGRGMALLEDAVSGLKPGEALAGETAFRLYDTYGFPLDLTQDALRPRGLAVDLDGFEAAMAQRKEQARASWSGSGDAAPDAVWFDIRQDTGPTRFLGYDGCAAQGVLRAIVKDGARVQSAHEGEDVALVFDATPFYAESGGQVGDSGEILFTSGATVQIGDTVKRAGDLHVHLGRVLAGGIAAGEAARLHAD